MTSERKRALILITTTLIIGILIGALGTGLFNHYGDQRRGSADRRGNGREGFINKVTEVVGADPEQAKQLRPYIIDTITQIDSIQSETDRNVRSVVLSLEQKLEPVLDEDQMKKLKEFHSRLKKQQR